METTSTITIAPMRTDRDARDAALLLNAQRLWLTSLGVELSTSKLGATGDYLDPLGFYAAPDALLLADVDGRRVGMVGLRRMRERFGVVELRRFFVLGIVRGQGVGTRLLDAAVEHARLLRYHAIEVRTAPRVMDRAQRLYRAAGFREAYDDDWGFNARFDIATLRLGLVEQSSGWAS
jgi:GNAT superfamily N-acetyltransferase